MITHNGVRGAYPLSEIFVLGCIAAIGDEVIVYHGDLPYAVKGMHKINLFPFSAFLQIGIEPLLRGKVIATSVCRQML